MKRSPAKYPFLPRKQRKRRKRREARKKWAGINFISVLIEPSPPGGFFLHILFLRPIPMIERRWSDRTICRLCIFVLQFLDNPPVDLQLKRVSKSRIKNRSVNPPFSGGGLQMGLIFYSPSFSEDNKHFRSLFYLVFFRAQSSYTCSNPRRILRNEVLFWA